jgi:hypothetical protein
MNNNSDDDYKLTDKLQLVKKRNIIAHETEVPFAKLIMSLEHSGGQMYRFWGPLFVFCYGKSIEELADEEESDDDCQSLYD